MDWGRFPAAGALALGLSLAACGGQSHDLGAPGEAGAAGSRDVGDDVDGATMTEPDADGADAMDEDIGHPGPRVHEGPPLTYYEHAKPILDAKCGGCHVEDGIGPMMLTRYDEVKPYVELIKYTVERDIMPPWTAYAPLDHFVGDRRLSETQKATLMAWIEQGAPAGDPDDEPESDLETVSRRLQDVDLRLRIPEYSPTVQPDDYRCFPLKWPEETTRYITALDIVPGERSIVHHAIIYHVQPEGAERVLALDAGDEGPGYSCFGASTGANAWLQSYEPGGYAQDVPGGLGFEVRPGSVMLLQVHYNTLNGNKPDRSQVEFKLEDDLERVGRVNLIMNPTWLAGFMPIPANQGDVVHTFRSRPLASGPQMIYWADLHMHALGSAGRIGIIRAGRPNVIEPLLVIPEWDFSWQETYILEEPVRLGPQDQLYVECHFDNTAGNQIVVDGQRLPPRDVNWGDGTTDEMCLGNVLIAPAE